jgi:hypothetical protein
MTASIRFCTLLLGMLCLGCGQGLDLAPVSGRVTLDGKPVTQGEVTFIPEDGPSAFGSIGADGTFRLTTLNKDDGALVGRHKVLILSTQVTGGSVAPTSFEQEMEWAKQGVASDGKVLIPGKTTWLVPEKYSRPDASDLTAEVKSGDNTLNSDLVGQ